MGRNRLRTRDVVGALIVGFIMGAAIGYVIGFAAAMEKGISLAQEYLNITISPELLQRIVMRYG